MYISDKSLFRYLTSIFFVLNLLLIGRVAFAQLPSPSSWNHVATYDEGFFNPGEFRILGGGKEPSVLLVLDHSASDQMLARLRLDDGTTVGHTIRSGRGPGEVSGKGMEISQFSDGGVLLWDSGHRRASVYDADLRFEGQVHGLQGLSVDPVALVNDSTLAVVMSSSTSELFRLYRLHQASESVHVAEEPLVTIKTVDHEVLDQGQLDENFMIRQGVARRIEDELYFGFMFGSLVTGMTENGLTWATTRPVNHALPVYNFRDGNAFVAPPLDKFSRGVLDLTGDESHLYVLYSGQKFEDDRGLLERITQRDVADGMEAIDHSDRLFVFDRATGAFVREMRLPIRAKALEVTSRYVVLLATEERDAPAFEVYRVPEPDNAP